MPWVAWVWVGVVVVAAVLLSFCGYEVAWKAKRLRRDVERLGEVSVRVQDLQAQAVALQDRLARALVE